MADSDDNTPLMEANPPQPGDKLEINRVWNYIADQLHRAYHDPANDYQRICDMFEASFGFDLKKSITYIPSEEKFLIFDDTP